MNINKIFLYFFLLGLSISFYFAYTLNLNILLFAYFILILFSYYKIDYALIFIFFLIPFTYVNKVHFIPISLNTLFYILIFPKLFFNLVLKRSFNLYFIFIYIFIILHYFFNNFSFSNFIFVLNISIFLILFLQYRFLNNKKVMLIYIFFSSLFGYLISSFFGLNLGNLTNIHPYLSEVFNGEVFILGRFSGLTNDPNIHGIFSLFNILFILILINSFQRVSILRTLFLIFLLIIFIYFGSISLSKTFILLVVLILILYFLSKTNLRILLIFALSVSILIYLFKDLIFNLDFIQNLIFRFFDGTPIEEVTLDIIFTGRIDIWHSYLPFFNSKIILGYGFNNSILSYLSPPHNTYIQIIIFYGLIPTIFTFLSLQLRIKNINLSSKNIFCVIPFLYFLFIDVFMFEFFWIYSALVYIIVVSKDYKHA